MPKWHLPCWRHRHGCEAFYVTTGLATRASAEAGGRPRNSCEASRANALFAHFTRIARASLKETQNHVLDARDQSIIGEEEFTHLWQLSDDALASTTALLKYLIGPK